MKVVGSIPTFGSKTQKRQHAIKGVKSRAGTNRTWAVSLQLVRPKLKRMGDIEMNVDTGELRRLASLLSEEERKQLLGEGFTEVPQDLEKEAMRELADKDVVMVDMEKKTPLTAWAKRVKQGRNEKCNCGSGKKYKYCCGK